MDLKNNYITIQGWMVQNLKLSGNTLLTFALINGFTQDGESEFSGSLNYICSWLNCTKPTAMKSLKDLLILNLIVKESKVVSNITFNKYRVNKTEIERILHGGKETFMGGKESCMGGGKDSLPNKDINNKYIEKDNIHTKFNFEKELLLLGCDIQHVKDFLQVRKGKRLANTLSSLNLIKNECERYNYPVKDAIKNCAEKGWGGFQYKWLVNNNVISESPYKKIDF